VFSNKKGQEMGLETIKDIVLLFLVAGLFTMFLVNFRGDTYFERSYLARDLSLIEHAVYASPGKILKYTYYPIGGTNLKLGSADIKNEKFNQIILSNFDYSFDQNMVEVKDKTVRDNVAKRGAKYYAYLKKEFMNIELKEPSSIEFKKISKLEILNSDE